MSQRFAQAKDRVDVIRLEYAFSFELHNQKIVCLNHILWTPLFRSIPQAIASLAAQEILLSKRLIRARTAVFVCQDPVMMKKIELMSNEIQELVRRLYALRAYLQSSCVENITGSDLPLS